MGYSEFVACVSKGFYKIIGVDSYNMLEFGKFFANLVDPGFEDVIALTLRLALVL